MFETLFGKKTGKSITPSEAKERLLQNENAILLDVRSPDEYREIHIPGSVLLPLGQIRSGISNIAPDKDAEIIVYCLSGMRASQAVSQLAAMGYTNVSNMGGIRDWRYEVEKG